MRDEIINEGGDKWWNLLCTYGLSLCNGIHTEGDYKGNSTGLGYEHQEESVLDYVAVCNSTMGTHIRDGTPEPLGPLPAAFKNVLQDHM